MTETERMEGASTNGKSLCMLRGNNSRRADGVPDM